MAPPTSKHLYWHYLRAFGLLLDLPSLIIIIVAGGRSHVSWFGLIGIGLYFSIVLNLRGLLPSIPDDELHTWYPVFGKIRHGLRIGFELLATILLVAGACFYAFLSSLRSVPLASIGAVVAFSIVSAYHLAMAALDLIFTIRDRRRPTRAPIRPVSGRFKR